MPPRHIAIIMDGNGRWAQSRGLDRVKGHEAGADTVRRIVRACGERGVEALTLYSFSTENWRRPELEVQALMALLARYLEEEADELMLNKVRLRGIGQTERLPRHVQMLLEQVTAYTAKNKGMWLNLALSYGGRAEIVRAVRDIARDVKAGALEPDAIDEADIAKRLYMADLPDPDLMIRTSGEYRLSNFLLWQLAYAELWVTDVLWPDFEIEHLDQAIASFEHRERRFGQTGAQVQSDEEGE
ncbi:MAG: isoprenyl transferase [Alphaproteobacteria bacterium]|nr:isoprenyl transferase [Alphaproteobacteria bacterium]